MIKPIGILDTVSRINNGKQREDSSIYYPKKSMGLQRDCLELNTQINFGAKVVNSIKPKNIEEVYQKLNTNLNDIKSSLSYYVDETLPKNKWGRVLLAIGTLGISEGYGQIKGRKNQQKAIDDTLTYANSEQRGYEKQMADNVREQGKQAQKLTEEWNAISAYYIAADKIQREELIPLIIAPLINKTSVPNCIMISAGDDATTDYLIEWTKDNANANVVTIDEKRDIVDYLEQAKEHYNNTGERTLLHIKNMDKLIHAKNSSEHTIGAMKSIMGDCAKYFNTTILFSSKNPDELDKIAMADHRVVQVRCPDLKEPELLKKAVALSELRNTVDYDGMAKRVINAIFTVLGVEDDIKIPEHELKAEDGRAIIDKIIDKWADVYAERVQNLNINYDYDVEPATISVQKGDKVEEFQGYKHTIKLDEKQLAEFDRWHATPCDYFLNKTKDFSFFSTKKHIENLPILPILYKAFCRAEHESNDKYLYRYENRGFYQYSLESQMHTQQRIPMFTNFTVDPNQLSHLLIKASEKLFEKNVESYKTGIEEVDRVYTDLKISPLSLTGQRQILGLSQIPSNEQFLSYEPKDSWFKYDLLHSYGDNGIFLARPDRSFSYDVNSLLNILNYTDNENIFDIITGLRKLSDYFKIYAYPDALKAEDMDVDKYEENQRLINSFSFKDDVLTPEEMQKQELISRLKDKKRNIESPIEALKDVLSLTKLDEKGIKLSENPTDEEISFVMREVRDYLLELTKEDMSKIANLSTRDDEPGYLDRYKTYVGSYFHTGPSGYSHRDNLANDSENYNNFFGISALVQIADEHLSGNSISRFPMYKTIENYSSPSIVYTGALLAMAKDMEHYDIIEACSIALEGIARRPIWYYEKGGKAFANEFHYSRY